VGPVGIGVNGTWQALQALTRYHAALNRGASSLIGGLSNAAGGLLNAAGVAAVPAAIGAVGGPVVDMLFPQSTNSGEQAELNKFKGQRFGPAPSGVANSATLNALNARGTRNLFIQDRGNAIPALHTAGAGPNGPNPNAIVQGQDGIGEEYRQRLAAYNNQATLARQALQGYDPSKGPLPGAAQEARDQGMEIWRGLYGGTKMGREGGAVGTFNPLMQAHGDVPSMEELWKGIGGGAPTTGPSNEAIKAAMAKGAAPGGFYPASTGPVPTTASFDTSFDPAAEAQAQQFRTASQAGVGTESSTALQRAGDFVQNFKLGALNPNNYSLPNFYNTDYSGIFK